MSRPSRGGRTPIRRRRGAALAWVGVAATLGCSPGPDRSPEAFCARLSALGEGRIDVGSADPNELVGHVASLEALMEAAPREVAADLETVRDVLADLRDAGGINGFMVFDDLRDPELAAVEARVTEFAAEHCGVRYGDPGHRVGELQTRGTRCLGWQGAGSPLTNNRFPYWLDISGANYFSILFWSVPFLPAPSRFIAVERGGRVELAGEYPHARYFAFHPNDVNLDNLDTLVDRALDPDPGSANPWRGPVPAGDGRRYTARLVFGPRPMEPSPNTSYVGDRRRGGFNPLVFLIYRIYAADLGSLPPNSAGVKLPSITVYDAEGEVVERFDECDPYPGGFEAPVDTTRFPAFPVPDHRAVFRAGRFDTASNFGLSTDLLSNRDVLYLTTYYSRTHGEVFAVRGRALRTPGLKWGAPPWARDLDIRMWSACAYNFWNGVANDCVLDEDAVVDAGGFTTLVLSDPAHRPSNASPERGVTWLDAGRFLDGQLNFRMLFAGDDLLRELGRAIETGEPSREVAPFVPETAHCSRETFESGGWQGCRTAWETR